MGRKKFFRVEIQGYKRYKITVVEHHAGVQYSVISGATMGGFRAKFIGLGGWVPSNYVYYDVQTKKLVKIDGDIRSVQAKTDSNGNLYVSEEDGSLVYIFDNNGKHLYTKTGFTGATVYSFFTIHLVDCHLLANPMVKLRHLIEILVES